MVILGGGGWREGKLVFCRFIWDEGQGHLGLGHSCGRGESSQLKCLQPRKGWDFSMEGKEMKLSFGCVLGVREVAKKVCDLGWKWTDHVREKELI